MKIQFLNGGLANQAFQYIFAKYYELSHGGDIMYLDDSYFALNTVHNGYELETVFGIKPHMLSECFDQDVWEYMLQEKRAGKSIPQTLMENGMDVCMITEAASSYSSFNPFNGKVWNIPVNQYYPEILDFQESEHIYYHGYWINYNYFAKYPEIFQKEFLFPPIPDQHNQQLLKRIQQEKSVCVHIRRGDYVTLQFAASIDAIGKNIRKFADNFGVDWTLFVFSDEIDWCEAHREELGFGRYQETVFVRGNTDGRNYIDMQLMSYCKGVILSNSAFCYLAALLNREKQVGVNPTSRELE